jgi:hypothetical protein
MSLVPYHQPAPRTFSWSLTAAIQLIRERRALNNTFRSNRNHTAAWTQVANNIFAAVGFVCTHDQCRSKWRALKRGYENMQRIYGLNPDNFPLSSPNNFDHMCFSEMTDEFWGPSSNYVQI